jgi:pyruvate dehydrogenase E2 component (dihydrolipoamide acetyltransferase)
MMKAIRLSALRTPFYRTPTVISHVFFSSYPDHEVVGLPALSPTMDAGTIGSWNVKEGDSFNAGDVIAEVETDKATMGFEAQDPGVVAKILVGTGTEIAVGTPIMIIVDDADSGSELVSAFADFKLPESEAPAVPAVEAPPTPTPAAAPVQTPTAAPTPAPVEAPSPAPAPVAAAPVAAVPEVVIPLPVQSSSQLPWGQMAKKSALAFKLGSDQKSYIEKYGSTGQLPIS